MGSLDTLATSSRQLSTASIRDEEVVGPSSASFFVEHQEFDHLLAGLIREILASTGDDGRASSAGNTRTAAGPAIVVEDLNPNRPSGGAPGLTSELGSAHSLASTSVGRISGVGNAQPRTSSESVEEQFDQLKPQRAPGRLEMILEKYQEMPHLLDPFLEPTVNALVDGLRVGMATVRRWSSSKGAGDAGKVEGGCRSLHPLFRLLYVICKVRGYKTIVKFLSHETSDLEPTLEYFFAVPKGHDIWESRYVLMLWLSHILMIPFNLSTIDSNVDKSQRGLAVTIMELGKSYLGASGKEREAAAVMLTRVLTRKDTVQQHLPSFLQWSTTELTSPTTPLFLRIGILQSLCSIHKLGPRSLLIETLPGLASICMRLLEGNAKDRGNPLVTKLVTKLAQRVGLCFLRPRLAPWRYQRGSRSLAVNLGRAAAKAESAAMNEEVDDDYDIPSELEEIIEIMLNGLRDKDTIVRWSAAKGIGRLSSRLPQDFATEIVSSVISLFGEGQPGTGIDLTFVSDHTWHGTCLAIAELARRGLLMPEKLAEVMPWITYALQFDVKRGSFSVGANVRDAACYVCWSISRAYDASLLAPFTSHISRSLAVVSALDREVNVRRAASAAFQEGVGRLGVGDVGGVPNGIEVVTIADYFAVGNRTCAALDVATAIARFDQYRVIVIDHVAEVKTTHWDKEIRELASKTLSKLAYIDLDYILSHVLPNLVPGFFYLVETDYVKIPMMTSKDLSTRHGSMLAVAEICLSWYLIRTEEETVSPWYTPEEEEAYIKPITKATVEYPRGYLESFGGDVTSVALCRLLDCLCQSFWPLGGHVDAWRLLLDASLERREEHVQDAAASAFSSLLTLELEGGRDMAEPVRLLCRKVCTVAPEDTYRKRGCALAVGRLPVPLAEAHGAEVVAKLVQALDLPAKGGDAEPRRNTVTALVSVIIMLGDSMKRVISRDLFWNACDSLMAAMEDYSIDQRGDVGSWVREASFKGWATLIPFARRLDIEDRNPYLSDEIVRTVVKLLVRQSVEKIDRVRENAGTALCKILWDSEIDGMLGEFEADLRSILTRFVDTASSDNKADILCVRYATSNFLEFTNSLPVTSTNPGEFTLPMLLDLFVSVFTDTGTVTRERLSPSLLEVADLLIGSGCVAKAVEETGWGDGALKLFEVVKAEVNRSKDVKKMVTALKIFFGLSTLSGANAATVRKKALSQSVIYLGHPYPRVRRSSSESVYLILTTSVSEQDTLNEGMEELEDLLLSTDWDQPLSEVKPIRQKIADHLKITLPKPMIK
ncbi:hypothetical protein HK101_010715 [Irineochytrium annulatum]|nr:hypothetical protein HK101_010715 [Irineochytrium annulatum]